MLECGCPVVPTDHTCPHRLSSDSTVGKDLNMASVLAWLDYSEADQRRAREIIAMFSQRESRDELGIGQIRDALSETLFPGTSVLLTRARYFLFVPWLIREGGRRGYLGPRLTSWVEWQERRLIGALQEGGDPRGLFGRYAGTAVRDLPSSIYWNSLQRFGILRHHGTLLQIAGIRRVSRPMDDATEFLEHSDAIWSPSIPAAPKEFFNFTRCDFALTNDEASWLAEQIAEAVPETMLQFLVTRGNRPSAGARYVWEDPEAYAAMGRVLDALEEARRFALAMHGAALLYNVLLAERAEELDLSAYEGHRDHFTSRLDEWRREVEVSDVGGWNLDQLWRLVAEQGRPVAVSTRYFITEWVDLTRRRNGHGLANDQYARELVRKRELYQKRSQARLSNDRLMRQWGGASGSDRLTFRWQNVKTLLNDIADGREGNRARS